MGYHRGSVVVVAVSLVLVVGMVTCETQDDVGQWNNILDIVLAHAKDEMIQRGRQELELREVERVVDKKFAFVRVRGNFKAEGGWLRDVTTARRVGNVTTSREGTTLKVAGTVSWDVMRLGYRHYRLDIGRVIEGELEVGIKKNAVKAVFLFDMVDGECRTRLDSIGIVELADLEVKITGLGFLNFLAEQIVRWFVDSRMDDINAKLEEMFAEAIPEHLDGFQCDEYASLFMVNV